MGWSFMIFYWRLDQPAHFPETSQVAGQRSINLLSGETTPEATISLKGRTASKPATEINYQGTDEPLVDWHVAPTVHDSAPLPSIVLPLDGHYVDKQPNR